MNAMLHGRVAIVTGAGRADGIGFAAARTLARYGADVVVTDVTGRRPDLSMAAIHEVGVGPDDLEYRAEELRGMNVRALASQLDVTDASNVADCTTPPALSPARGPSSKQPSPRGICSTGCTCRVRRHCAGP